MQRAPVRCRGAVAQASVQIRRPQRAPVHSGPLGAPGPGRLGGWCPLLLRGRRFLAASGAQVPLGNASGDGGGAAVEV